MPKRSHGTRIDSSSRSYSNAKRSFSSIAPLALPPISTLSTTSKDYAVSGMSPVQSVRDVPGPYHHTGPPPLPLFLLPGGKCFRMLGSTAATCCKQLDPTGFGVKIFQHKDLGLVWRLWSIFSYELRATSREFSVARFQFSEERRGLRARLASGSLLFSFEL